MLPSKMKETTFQILNRTIWTRNKAFKSGLAHDPTCLRCKAPETTLDHLLYNCEHHSAKIWTLLGRALTFSLSWETSEYIPAISLTPLEIVFNKPHPSLLLHFHDSNTWKAVSLLLQEVKHDIVFRHAQLQEDDKKNYSCAYNPI
jgi:hypothetical protein